MNSMLCMWYVTVVFCSARCFLGMYVKTLRTLSLCSVPSRTPLCKQRSRSSIWRDRACFYICCIQINIPFYFLLMCFILFIVLVLYRMACFFLCSLWQAVSHPHVFTNMCSWLCHILIIIIKHVKHENGNNIRWHFKSISILNIVWNAVILISPSEFCHCDVCTIVRRHREH